MRLIDADALKDNLVNDMVVDGWETITAYMEGKRGRSGYIDGIVDALACIENADTVDPVKHGKWKERTIDDEERMVYCSVCGDEYREQEVDLADWVKDFFNFCPNCGAKMERSEDEL